MGSSVVNGKIYLIAGTHDEVNQVSTVEVYDPVTDTWAQKADMPTPRSLFGISRVGENIYIMGGNVFGLHTTVEAYNPVTDTWTQKADIPTPRWNTTASMVGGKIYVIGGTSGGGVGIRTVEEYDTGVREPQSVTHQGKLATIWGEIKLAR